MEALIIKPANKEESDLFQSIAKKMKIKFSVIDDEDKEDYGLTKAMLAVKTSKKVSEDSIIKKLKK